MKPKWNNIALMSVIIVLTICLLAMPAIAYYNNDGWPVTTRASGTINGTVFIDSEDNFQNWQQQFYKESRAGYSFHVNFGCVSIVSLLIPAERSGNSKIALTIP